MSEVAPQVTERELRLQPGQQPRGEYGRLPHPGLPVVKQDRGFSGKRGARNEVVQLADSPAAPEEDPRVLTAEPLELAERLLRQPDIGGQAGEAE